MKVIVTSEEEISRIFLHSLATYYELESNKIGANISLPPTPKKYNTRKETAKELNVSLPTLTKYVNEGLIKASRIGARVLFERSDIDNAIVKQQYK